MIEETTTKESKAMYIRTLVLIFFTGLCVHLPLSAQQISRSVLSSGGATISNGALILKSTVGQAVIGTATNAERQQKLGYWQRAGGLITGVDRIFDGLSDRFRLKQNYPNPFNSVTTIRFTVPRQTHVSLVLFDLMGRQVATLVDEELAAGEYQVRLEASHLTSGVYFYRMLAGAFMQIRKLTVLK
ncbi:MAG: T9SS type A sorting domain-containing protein [Rhodothermus sp.]|nr:T9SS type A sorting domain-containing protein [Rhodothermus sp.]